jgi:hypothetical protein
MGGVATRDDVRRIALALPETSEGGGFTFAMAGKSFAWPWMERVDPRRARVANPEVMGIRVASQLEKQSLLALDSEVFFTEPHYDGYPAVLVRLAAIDVDLLEQVLTDAWRSRAPRRLLDELGR